ncbi:MAG: hypothetical protein ACTSO9_03010 [Candidatus Helarchaeota archaeon]
MSISPELLQLISVIELFAAALLAVILSNNTFHKYKQVSERSTLYMALNFLLTGFALVFIAIDRILLMSLLDPIPGLIFHNLALYFSLFIILLLDLFAFEMTYPDKIKILAAIMAVLLIISGIVLAIYQPHIDPLDFNKEIIYPDILILLLAPFLFPPILIPLMVFLYFSAAVRKDSKPNSLRALTMGIACIIITICYIFEVIGITGVIVIIIRLGFVIYVVLMYISLTLPKWYQKAIGWEK